MFVTDVKCSQATWQTITNSRTGSSKASVSEAVVRRLCCECLACEGGLVELKLAGCDGGQKEQGSGPENVLQTNWSCTQTRNLPPC